MLKCLWVSPNYNLLYLLVLNIFINIFTKLIILLEKVKFIIFPRNRFIKFCFVFFENMVEIKDASLRIWRRILRKLASIRNLYKIVNPPKIGQKILKLASSANRFSSVNFFKFVKKMMLV